MTRNKSIQRCPVAATQFVWQDLQDSSRLLLLRLTRFSEEDFYITKSAVSVCRQNLPFADH
ncbi:hypothetical protein E2C01_043085 [Portunus trituberculatus]|uniref:Uncharacterized protein n=1 Tax=Portunus trituberculatus TaxID=210409 RepID=A0A5B7FV52_PORTR|nr:hypothetical protein [Portunus trituberculatus]